MHLEISKIKYKIAFTSTIYDLPPENKQMSPGISLQIILFKQDKSFASYVWITPSINTNCNFRISPEAVPQYKIESFLSIFNEQKNIHS